MAFLAATALPEPPVAPEQIIAAPQPAPEQAPAAPTAPEKDAPEKNDGTIIVRGHFHGWAPDPVQQVNKASFAAIQTSDRLVVAPVAKFYEHTLPEPLRDGLHNAIYNLREPSVFAGFLLEHKFGKAGATAVRFAVNSTVGIGGLIDVASRRPLRLPRRANGLADAMGYYGIKPGPYMFLPLVGPTTARDLVGTFVDHMALPAIIGPSASGIAYSATVTIVGGLDDRVRIAPQLHEYRDNAPDPYKATKDFYLRRRQAEIDGLRDGK